MVLMLDILLKGIIQYHLINQLIYLIPILLIFEVIFVPIIFLSGSYILYKIFLQNRKYILLNKKVKTSDDTIEMLEILLVASISTTLFFILHGSISTLLNAIEQFIKTNPILLDSWLLGVWVSVI